MNEVLKVLLSMSLSGSLLILILLCCKRFLKNRISRQWQYYIWLIVIAQLLLPFAPEINPVPAIFKKFDNYQTKHIQNKLTLSDIAIIEQSKPKNIKQATTNKPNIITLVVNNLGLIWLIVAFILFTRKMTIYQSFVQYIKAGQTPVDDIELLDYLSIIEENLRMKKPIELCVNPLVSSPLLIGFIHPYIVLPNKNISQKNFHYTILHELTHYKQLDMFYKWLVQITICLHWFNPLVYFMESEINKACEFSCDEIIIKKLDASNIKEYGKTLLDAMETVGKYKGVLATLNLSENKKLLKERLDAIMKFKRKSKLCTLITAILTCILCLGATSLGSTLKPSLKQNKNISSTAYKTNKKINFGKFNNLPIQWEILEINNNNEALLFATDTLDDILLPFDNKSNEWESSYIRSWLNGTEKDEFLSDDNFTSNEKNAIIQTQISSGILGNPTNDFVFLISKDEYYRFGVGNVSYDVNSYLTRTGENYSDHWLNKYSLEDDLLDFGIELNNYPGNVVVFSSNHQVSGSFNASEKGGIRPMMWIDLNALNTTDTHNIDKPTIVVNSSDTITFNIQAKDNLISSISGRRYKVFGPFDGNNIKSVTCQLNNDVKARLEIAISNQNKSIEGAVITNSIGFGKTYTETIPVSKEQFYVFIGSDNVQNLTGEIKFSTR